MKTVAVHNGKFHADDVFSIAILRKIYPELEVIRTRDPEKLASVDARVDVGMKYNPETLDFDHHQSESAGERENGISYASVGLIWKHFGMELVNSLQAWTAIDESLIQPLDADDCGISTYETTKGVSPYTIPKIIARMNPNWKEDASSDQQFEKSVAFATLILERELLTANNQAAADQIILEALEKRTDKRYLILETYCPYKKLIKDYPELLYVIFQGTGQWCINAVEEKEFVSKKLFPKSWWGLEKEELRNISGIETADFCHKTGFFFACQTKEDALLAVEKSLEQD
ncbi:MAG: MYG1 family protein [Nanoarchaeota archaeon]|nr:MYG1 family protein [Nanoarchaeota archaeon]